MGEVKSGLKSTLFASNSPNSPYNTLYTSVSVDVYLVYVLDKNRERSKSKRLEGEFLQNDGSDV